MPSKLRYSVVQRPSEQKKRKVGATVERAIHLLAQNALTRSELAEQLGVSRQRVQQILSIIDKCNDVTLLERRENTLSKRAEQIIALASRPHGCTLQEVMTHCGISTASAYFALITEVRKKKNLKIKAVTHWHLETGSKKVDQVVALCRRPQGCSLKDITTKLGVSDKAARALIQDVGAYRKLKVISSRESRDGRSAVWRIKD